MAKRLDFWLAGGFGATYWVSLCLVCGLAGGVAGHEGIAARENVVDPPVRVTLRPDGGERVDGILLRYDTEKLTVQSREGDPVEVVWSSIRAARALWVFERVLDQDDARGWFEAAVLLFAADDQRNEGERALSRALQADPSLEPLAEGVRAGEIVDWPEPATENEDAEAGGPNVNQGEAAELGAAGPNTNAGPRVVGELQTQFWGELSPELMASSVDQLKQEAEAVKQATGLKLRLYEDANFLVYSNLPSQEAKRWVGLLDDMYARLIETFDMPEGKNIFRGKCLIYILQEPDQYYHLCSNGLGFNVHGTLGVCFSRGDGHVIVVLFRQPDTLDFAYVLVHEAVHAFVHRYRSHPFVPSWINEGLAEHIAHNLIHNRGFGEGNFATSEHDARRLLRYFGSMQGMFHARHIEGWQYPVARQLCAFMLRQSSKRYKAFIDAIKDGKHWQAALVEDYGIEPEALAEAFGRSIDVRDLRP